MPIKTEDQERWNNLHTELKSAMQQELSLSRELLANMHQEELSLMLHDQGSWNQVMQQRANMVERLSSLRLQRQEMTREISQLLGEPSVGHNLEKILPLNEEISYEIFNLSDQLMALTERMNRQQGRNQHLAIHAEPLLSLPSSTPPPVREARAKRKAIVATYHLKQ